MPGFVTILGIVLLGAMLGFLFSKKGQEKDGAIQGAKTTCGCLFVFTLLAIGAIILLAVMAGGAFS